MPIDAPYPFDGYRMYGPRIHQGRRIVYLVRKGDSSDRTTLAYAKYLMSIHLGRWLDSYEHVDHVNDNSLDDRLENYQVLTYGPHSTKHSKGGLKRKRYECEYCHEIFVERDDGKNRRFCSHDCLYASMRKPVIVSSVEYESWLKNE